MHNKLSVRITALYNCHKNWENLDIPFMSFLQTCMKGKRLYCPLFFQMRIKQGLTIKHKLSDHFLEDSLPTISMVFLFIEKSFKKFVDLTHLSQAML